MLTWKYRYCAKISTLVIKKSAVTAKQCRIKFCNSHTGAMTHTRWHPTMTHHRPRQEIARSQSTQTKDICISYIYLHVFFYFAEATGIIERSPKRAAVSELKSSSNGASGRSSLEEVNEMPVLTRVCSPATLPRLKRFRFRPIDGESCFLLNLRWLLNLFLDFSMSFCPKF